MNTPPECAPLVLAIDDEPAVLRLFQLELPLQGFRLITAASAEEGLRLEAEKAPHLVLLDIVMPGMSGWEVLAALRTRSAVPVIVLSARASEGDRARAEALGADDFLSKPFRPGDLGERIRTALRRKIGDTRGQWLVRIGALEIDFDRHRVRRGCENVQLTGTEWRLMEEIARDSADGISNEELLGRVWGSQFRGDTPYLRLWMTRLRRKLDDDPRHPQVICNSPNGYRLNGDAANPAA